MIAARKPPTLMTRKRAATPHRLCDQPNERSKKIDMDSSIAMDDQSFGEGQRPYLLTSRHGRPPHQSPDKYIQQVLDLQEQGAPVGGVGIQGHIDSPVGSVVCSALDKLGIVGLPLWFTELDVSSTNEYIRVDDLEVILREAFAHPAVEGIVLWGFWELFMSRDNSHLVDAEGNVNEAGRRYLSLKREWLSHARGCINDQGAFCFRGFHGTYNVEVVTLTKRISKTFTVDNGDSPLEVTIDM